VFPLIRPWADANIATIVDALVPTAVAGGIVLPLVMIERLAGLDVFAIPFVASAGAVALAPAAPLVRPRAIALGYFVAALVSLAITTATGPSMYAAALAAAISIMLMALLKAPHVPAVAAAAVIGLNNPGIGYLLDPLLPAVASVIITALVIGRLLPKFNYPLSWR